MSKERELLQRVLDTQHNLSVQITYEIEELLAQPEQTELEPEAWIIHNTETGYKTQVATKPVGFEHEVWEIIPLSEPRNMYSEGFIAGINYAKKYGIGANR
jgi:hypothetical protein